MTAIPPGSPRVPAGGGAEEFRGDAAAPPEVGIRADGSTASAGGGLTTVTAARAGDRPRIGRTRRCRCAQSRSPGRAPSVQQGWFKVVLNDDPGCRWFRSFVFGGQGSVWFRVPGRADSYLDDWRNWPTSTDCPVKIRETAAIPRPQDQDTHFWSLN